MDIRPPATSLRSAASLRRRLLSWILLPLTALIGVNAWIAYGNAVQTTNEAYDRSLYLAARTLAEELTWRDGRLTLDVLGGTGYVFENHTGSRLFYRVTSAAGDTVAGDTRLPALPPSEEISVRYFALVRFGDGSFLGQPVRVAELAHVVEDTRVPQPLVRITVVETLEARQQLIAQILRDTLTSQGLLLLAAALLVVAGVQFGIRPLEAFRQRLAARDDDDFSPIELPDVPRELRPLMATFNGYLQRLGRLIEIRKRFLDNAAHQLRTPLTALKTQLAVAQRDGPSGEPSPALMAARKTTDDAVRLTEQLLAMTRVEHASEMHSHARFDLLALARQVTDDHLLRAHQRGDDLGFEARVTDCQVEGVEALVHEALTNLIDNALHHTDPGTRITVRVGAAWVEVEDNGPGIAAQHQPHVFERFYRGAPASRRGSGLGLAIVREIALQQSATLTLVSPVRDGRGCLFRLAWPAPLPTLSPLSTSEST